MWRYLKARLSRATGPAPAGRGAGERAGGDRLWHPGLCRAGAVVGIAPVAGCTMMLSSNRRFRRSADGQALQPDWRHPASAPGPDRQPARRLAPATHRPAGALCRVLDLYKNMEAGLVLMDNAREALTQLENLYLKLLVARQCLSAMDVAAHAQHP